MGSESAGLGTTGVVVLVIYLCSLIGIGWLGRRARQENTLADHFLAGRNLGLLVLFFTLYASQYSGNTLVGYAGNAYRQGFLMIMSATGMMAVIAVMMIYAPRLQRLSQIHHYLTPSDFIEHRYSSRVLATCVSLLCIWVLANYILSNLVAMGAILETTSGHRIPYVWGVIGLALIMVVYESLGGMRSVAWTDLIQGLILLAGIALLFVLVVTHYGGPSGVAERLGQVRPGIFNAPTAEQKRTWLSTILLLGFGIAVYPHLIQRLFAARDTRSLRRSLQLMVFMPLCTTLLVVLIAVVGIARFPDLGRADSDRILMRLIADMQASTPILWILLVLFISAAVAAIMSTVDSALLSLASLFTRDLYQPLRARTDQAHLTRVGKGFSWATMAVMTALALLRPRSLWWLIELKLVYFVQVVPAILLGVTSRRLTAGPVLLGLGAGIGVTLLHTVLVQTGVPIAPKPWGIHAGIWGLAANFATVGVAHAWRRR